MNGVLAAFLVILATAGCEKKPLPGQEQNQEQQGQEKPEQPTGPYFKAELPDECVLGYNDGNMSWGVETNITDWTAVSDAEWCKPKTEATFLRLDVTEYDCRYDNGQYKYDPPRTCTVTVKAGTVFTKSIKVVQNTHTTISFPQQEFNSLRYDWILSGPSGMTVLLSADGETRDVVIQSNAYLWAPSTEADWLTVSRVDGSTLRVTSKARDASVTTPRSAKVKVEVVYAYNEFESFTVQDAPANLDDEGYGYGDHTDWD